MYYFFMDRNFNLDKYDFDVNFSPRLTKAERDLLNIFLDNVDKKNDGAMTFLIFLFPEPSYVKIALKCPHSFTYTYIHNIPFLTGHPE